MLFLVLGAIGLLIVGLYLAFGPMKIDSSKLRPGQIPEEVIKKSRRMGYMIIALCVTMLLLIYFVIAPMNPY